MARRLGGTSAIDLLLAGENYSQEIQTLLFLNQNGEFIETSSGLENVRESAAAFGDYDADGYTDLIILGNNNGGNRITKIYKNHHGTFVEHSVFITGLDHGDAGWTDFDHDGFLDFAITGNKNDPLIENFGNSIRVDTRPAAYTAIYHNNGDNSFEKKEFRNQLAHAFSSLDLGDYDNDGYADILVTGVPAFQYVTINIGGNSSTIEFRKRSMPKIIRNVDGLEFYSIQPNIPAAWAIGGGKPKPAVFSRFESSSISFGDYDNDGDLDILRNGREEMLNKKSAIYKSQPLMTNTTPTIPNNLNVSVECERTLFSWNEARDDHTPPENIVYEIYIGTAPGVGNVFSKQNSRKLRNTYFEASDLDNGTYYWSVKAVDGARYGSDYAAEQTLVINRPEDVAIDTTLCFGETLTVNGLSYSDSGVYTDTLLLDGCPITQQVTLEVLPEKTAFIDTTLCAGESLVINGATYGSSVSNAVEVVTGVGPLGCDSTIYVTITVLPEKIHYLDTTICKGDMLIVNGNTYSEPVVGALEVISGVGEYGCDSIVVINLEVRDVEELIAPEEVAITTADTLLITTEQSFESYLWQDGSTLPYFIVSGLDYEPGEYLFTLLATDEWGCAWRDSVLVTIELFVNANDDPSLRTPRLTTFPNPADRVLNLINNGTETKIQITLRDLQGRSLYEVDWDGKGIFSLNSGRFPRGAYFLHWQMEDDAGTLRVVFQ